MKENLTGYEPGQILTPQQAGYKRVSKKDSRKKAFADWFAEKTRRPEHFDDGTPFILIPDTLEHPKSGRHLAGPPGGLSLDEMRDVVGAHGWTVDSSGARDGSRHAFPKGYLPKP